MKILIVCILFASLLFVIIGCSTGTSENDSASNAATTSDDNEQVNDDDDEQTTDDDEYDEETIDFDCIDADSDGYGNGCDLGVDCDDSLATGSTCTSGCLSYYEDSDGDSYGDASVAVTTCTAPTGFVADNSDCDPASTEHWSDCGVCADADSDGYGNGCDLGGDCDDSPATGSTCASGCLIYYEDSDGDSYGDASVAVTTCTAPSGFVADDSDCDDQDDTLYLGNNPCPPTWSVDENTLAAFDFGEGFAYAVWNDPTVLLEDGSYRMWLTAGDPTIFPIAVSVYEATSSDGLTWNRNDTPLLEPGASGEWDDQRIETPSVTVDGDGTYHLYYSGCSAPCNTGVYSIGHATSADGTVWTKDPHNPVIVTQPDPTRWGFYTAAEPAAAYDPGTGEIYLYYVSATGLPVDGSGTFGILLATSANGSDFTYHIDGEGKRIAVKTLGANHPDDVYRGYSTPGVVIDEWGVFHLVYDLVRDPTGFEQVGLAYSQSSDGLIFNEVTSEIVFIDDVAWRTSEIRAPAPLLVGNQLVVWFAGSGTLVSWDTFQNGIGRAVASPGSP
jgi:hypothetical protein